MESLNFQNNSQENISELRNNAIEFSDTFLHKQEEFLSEITEIVESNDALRRAVQEYGNLGESLAGFRLHYGRGGGNTSSLDFKANIDANVAVGFRPQIEIIEGIGVELDDRMAFIKDSLNSFSGTQDEAFDLIKKIHQEKVLPTLNSQENPILA